MGSIRTLHYTNDNKCMNRQTHYINTHTHTLTHIQRSTHQKGLSFLHLKLCLHLLFLKCLVYFELHLKIYIFAVWVSLLVREKDKKCFVRAISGALYGDAVGINVSRCDSEITVRTS